MLSAFSWLYSKIIDQRNAAYKSGTFKSQSLSVPVISVGNITVGGTGKTPLVELLAGMLAENGEKVCVISRGYKRKDPKQRVLVSDGEKVLTDVQISGDEPFELAQNLLGKAIVISDADRVEAGKWAVEKFGVTAIVLDDAFQHRKIARDLDIVVIDATDPFGNEKTLPAGTLRESLENLERADLFILTRAKLSKNLNEIKKRIRDFNQNSPIITCENRTKKILDLEDFPLGTGQSFKLSKDTSLLAFCALGNPRNFFEQLETEGFNISHTKSFGDHHSYNQKDIDLLNKLASSKGSKGFITTVKDAVKLYQLEFKKPCYIAKTELVISEKEKLREMIDAVSKP